MVETVRSTIAMANPQLKEVQVNLVWRPPWDPKKATDDGKVMLGAMGVRVD